MKHFNIKNLNFLIPILVGLILSTFGKLNAQTLSLSFKQLKMKNLLKKYKNLLYVSVIAFSLGCFKSDPCENVYCQNGGTCVDGSCSCPDGYEGENCEIQTGYDCDNGNCKYVQYRYSSPDYKTYQACKNVCGGNTSNDCSATPFYGNQTCNSGYVNVGTGCCPIANPYLGVQTNKCYTSCISAKNAGNSSIIYGTGQTQSYSGYNCVSGNCLFTTNNPTYFTHSACQSACGNTGGDCFSTPYYGTQNCGSGNVSVGNGCCPINYPYLGSEKNLCYNTCLAAKQDGNTTIVYGTGIDNGGGNTNGQVMFWIKSDLGCGNIKVKVSGLQQTISSYYSGGVPNCGASGCATFSLQPGNYSYSGQCSNLSFSGTAQVTNGGCLKIQLTK